MNNEKYGKVVGYNIWKKVFYTMTPGGDPLWECPLCHNGRHVYGVEEPEKCTHICRDCGAELIYPWEE